MEIKTKFNINDKVFAITTVFNEKKDDFEWAVEHTQRIIKRVGVCFDDYEVVITYHTQYSDGSWCISYYNEKNIFATKEQAQAECDRRNKGE